MRTVLANCGPIVHANYDGVCVGNEMSNEDLIYPSGKAIVIKNNQVEKIISSVELLDDINNVEYKVIDVGGRAIIPGLIDSHSHMVWAGDRSQEVRWKQQGYSYADIANMGGGISSTVAATREANKEELYQVAKRRLKCALRSGTTHVETKSGYGLNLESEIKLLEVAKMLHENSELPSIDSTWMGAHAVPRGYTMEAYMEELLTVQLPGVVESGLARSADVFCEPGWFGLQESEDILKASRRQNLNLRIHIDEFVDGGGGELAAELKVDSADHAHYTNNNSRLLMKEAHVNTGFLPGTPYSMGSNWPDFNAMIKMEAPWTIATDFNPNNQILSMPFIGSCLVQRCNVDPLAALIAATANPAQTTPHPSGLPHGRICEGAIANMNILNSKYWESWCLKPGHSAISATVLEGIYIEHEI